MILCFCRILLEKVLVLSVFLIHPKLFEVLVYLSHMGPGLNLVQALWLFCALVYLQS